MIFSSGETTPSGRLIFNKLFHLIAGKETSDKPLEVAILETPAGFELNSAQVAGRVGDFIRTRLQNYDPQITVVPARRRDSRWSTDDPEIVAPLLTSEVIFMGPGSPSYAVKQLRNSLAWHTLLARHRLGAGLVFASAATVAIGAYALPVYEIYKVGEELHWKEGLDLLGPFGLSLVFIPHWNNQDGGEELDTSRCFMGLDRFTPLLSMLPEGMTVVGIDEQTGLLIEPTTERCQVIGKGGVTILSQGEENRFKSREEFSIYELGEFSIPAPQDGLPQAVWQRALEAQSGSEIQLAIPDEVTGLVLAREEARACRDWAMADQIRQQLTLLGWQVSDTPQGPRVEPVKSRE